MATIDIGGLAIPEAALTFKFVRASGPGGQNVNKVATAAQCRLDLDAAGIEGPLRLRLEGVAGKRLTVAGEIVVSADTHRTQARNRAEALSRLAAMIEEARTEPRPRRPTRPSARAKANRLTNGVAARRSNARRGPGEEAGAGLRGPQETRGQTASRRDEATPRRGRCR